MLWFERGSIALRLKGVVLLGQSR